MENRLTVTANLNNEAVTVLFRQTRPKCSLAGRDMKLSTGEVCSDLELKAENGVKVILETVDLLRIFLCEPGSSSQKNVSILVNHSMVQKLGIHLNHWDYSETENYPFESVQTKCLYSMAVTMTKMRMTKR